MAQEHSVNAELLQHYGWDVRCSESNGTFLHGVTASSNASTFYHDLLSIFRSLHVVVNNGPNRVGGGGKPTAPLAPPICKSDDAAAPAGLTTKRFAASTQRVLNPERGYRHEMDDMCMTAMLSRFARLLPRCPEKHHRFQAARHQPPQAGSSRGFRTARSTT